MFKFGENSSYSLVLLAGIYVDIKDPYAWAGRRLSGLAV